MEKLNLAQQKHAFKTNLLQHKINTKNLKPGLVALYDIRSGNAAGIFTMEKISKGADKETRA